MQTRYQQNTILGDKLRAGVSDLQHWQDAALTHNNVVHLCLT